MLDKLTDNMKFMLMLVVYTGSMAWWAATVDVNVTQNATHIEKTLVILEQHTKNCEKLKNLDSKLEYEIKILQHEIKELKEEK